MPVTVARSALHEQPNTSPSQSPAGLSRNRTAPDQGDSRSGEHVLSVLGEEGHITKQQGPGPSKTPTDVTLRPLTSDDVAAALEILHAGGVLPPKSMAVYLESPTPENGFAFGTAAVVDGSLAGVAIALGLRVDLPLDLSSAVAHLDGIAVAPQHQGAGIGTVLLDDTVRKFQQFGHRGILARLAAGRRELPAFYTKHGWSIGLPGQGTALKTERGPVAVMEDPTARVARRAFVHGSESPFL
ncbi:GNAT family N-acetyltransferase [Streptomyces sp. NPDC058326]|uniref:GNAT family N-acetyltransferase n=1 Tax=Streptomyces sp. NPDC058326 TaxID=3346447 RepID=UPI0036F06057